MKTFTLYHLNPNIKTLEDFCRLNGVYFDSKDSKEPNRYTIEDFFNDSREAILRQMTDRDKKNYIKENNLSILVSGLTASDLNINMTLPCPLKLVVDNRFVTYTLTAKHNTFQEAVTDVSAFEDSQIRGVIAQDVITYKGANRKKAKCSVIGFFKSLYYQKNGNDSSSIKYDNVYQLQEDFTDISNFIISLSTSTSAGGGTFSFQLPHVPFMHNFRELGGHMGTDIKKDEDISSHMSLDTFDEMYRYNASGESSPLVKTDMEILDYWLWLIGSNDLVFISFDDVGEIRNNSIAGKSYDMIGLVDEVTVSRDSNGNITVTVSGKDLIKLLQDDSALYFPCSTVYNQGNLFDNVEAIGGDKDAVMTVNGKVRQTADSDIRIPSPDSNALIRLFKEECNGFSIDYIIKVVISSLVNMQICPSEIFSSWGDRVTTFQYLTPKNEKNNQTDKKS